jgi:hypothetical protein
VVVTAFVVDSYRALQPDNASATLLVLQQISLQLANSSTPAFSDIPFQPKSSDIRVNIFWFLGLILALSAALFGFLMKQWLRAYMTWIKVPSRQKAIGIRQYRYENLVRWKFDGIRAGLSVLMQFSLLLFLVGLVDFSWHLDSKLSSIITAAVVLCLWAVVMTILLSAFTQAAPFRTPLSRQIMKLRQRLTSKIRHPAIQPISQWADFDQIHVGVRNWSSRAIAYLWSVSQNSKVLCATIESLYHIDIDRKRTTTLYECWPILEALDGFITAENQVEDTDQIMLRADSLSIPLRQRLARLLSEALIHDLDSISNSDEEYLRGPSPEPHQIMRLVPVLLRGTEMDVLTYMTVLNSVASHMQKNSAGPNESCGEDDEKFMASLLDLLEGNITSHWSRRLSS